jgi:hypothetical protein
MKSSEMNAAMGNSATGDLREMFRFRRYGGRAFFPYRFAPGHSPHPTEHSQGHSFRPPGTPMPKVPLLPPEHWRTDEDYLFGCDLYNHAFWWEAHEAWEGLWRLCEPEGISFRFLQGLIQVSAAHLKLFLGRPTGVCRLRERAQGYLSSVAKESGPVFMGLDVPRFLEELDRYFGSRPEDPPARTAHDPGAYPYLKLAR